MNRSQIALLAGLVCVLALGLGSMSTASVPDVEQPVAQTIADPFCATTRDDVVLDAATVIRRDSDLSVTWRFAGPPPPRAVVKVDISSTDFRYHWLVAASVENGRVAHVQTLDTVSNQVVGYDVTGVSTAGRIIGNQIEVTAPLPGAPTSFNWFAAASADARNVSNLTLAGFVSFCPAGWLAQYPPSA